MPLFNDLLADPELRNRFQFWFFRYSSGNPVAVSATLLRETLLEAERICDAERNNPAFQDAVIVGHSMGGLVSKLQVFDGGERAWKLVSDKPLDEMDLSDAEKARLRRVIYFEHVPFVKRVVFMATPHRGAEKAAAWYARWAQDLVSLPKSIVDTTIALGKSGTAKLRGAFAGENAGEVSGLMALAPDSVLASEVSKWPFPAGLPIHSIIGNEEAADTPGGSDGYVPHWSSHLDDVVSEKIVLSGHNVQTQPLAVKELIRILREHLRAHDARLAQESVATPTGK
jgi:pimeloyl-ACP methyl ester carboxylesterase